MHYAGFWKRFGAYFLDGIVNSLIVVLFFLVWMVFELFLNAIGVSQTFKESILGTLGVPLYLSLSWLYFALFESSSKKATIGKMAFGIEVVDINDNRISFLRASARYWLKLLSALLLCIGFIMAAFTQDKQALHDMISRTYVVNKQE
jgi:uncharacterized RDD family membrane protein YckC